MTTANKSWIPTRLSVSGWVIYDLANTIFALGISALYFPDWLTENDTPDLALALAIDAAMVAVVFLGPWIGARSDHRGKRMPYLLPATLVAVVPTLFLASVGVYPSLALFAVALVGFNLGGVIYDALLPDVSTPDNRGKISGIGVAVGYVGSAIALGAGILLLDSYGHAVVFRAIAVLFLIFAVPTFLWVKERPRQRAPGPPPAIRQSMAGLVAAWRRARQYPGVARFLIGRFCYTDAINTLIGGFLTIFVKEELGFSAGDVELLLGIAIVTAMLGGAIAATVIDRIGPRAVLHAALNTWIVAIALGILAAVIQAEWIAWGLGAIGGAAIGATWASDRTYMARITPPHRYGEFYGLYATVGRFATILGPLMWGVLVTILGFPREVAMGALIVFLVISRIVLRGVSDHERNWDEETSASTQE